MEDKIIKKERLFSILFFLAIVIIIMMGVYIYKINESKTEKFKENVVKSEISIGTFIADEDKFDEAGVSYKDCGVTLDNNNLCSVYQGFGSSRLGTYSIDGNKLICNTLINRTESGETAYFEANVVYEFEIVDTNKIKLTKIIDNSGKAIDSTGLEEGMTYSFSENEKIDVLVDSF